MLLTAKVPPTVTVPPLSLSSESAIVWPAVNLAILPAVPPGLLTPPPAPAQLPAVVHKSKPLSWAPVAETVKYLVKPVLLVISNKLVPSGLAPSWMVKAEAFK